MVYGPEDGGNEDLAHEEQAVYVVISLRSGFIQNSTLNEQESSFTNFNLERILA